MIEQNVKQIAMGLVLLGAGQAYILLKVLDSFRTAMTSAVGTFVKRSRTVLTLKSRALVPWLSVRSAGR